MNVSSVKRNSSLRKKDSTKWGIITEGLEPTTIEEAKVWPDWPKWEEAINAELKSLDDAHTWNVVEHPKNTNTSMYLIFIVPSSMCYNSLLNAIPFLGLLFLFTDNTFVFTNYPMLLYNYSSLIIMITPPSNVITWWLVPAYLVTILHCSFDFSFTYFILPYEPALNTRSTVYKRTLNEYPSLQASSPLTPLIPYSLVLVNLVPESNW